MLTLTDRHWYLSTNNTVTNAKMKFGDGSVLSSWLYFFISYDGKKLFVVKLLKAKHQLALFVNAKINEFGTETY